LTGGVVPDVAEEFILRSDSMLLIGIFGDFEAQPGYHSQWILLLHHDFTLLSLQMGNFECNTCIVRHR
jgi:hypothetical protein